MNEIFSEHAKEILGNPTYTNWKEIEKGKPCSGIMTIALDLEGIIRKWKIIPSEDYPNTPPIIFGEPPDTDICNRNGQLVFTENGKESPWLKLVNIYSNPLIPLLNELLQKYRVGI